MNSADFGITGLAVMGQNLARNVESRGFTVVVYNRTAERTRGFIKEHGTGKKIVPAYSLEEFVETLTRPRKILLMVKAGEPTDAVLQSLLPLLEEGDIVMDGGNSHYEETERRLTAAEERGLCYVGVGISGGEAGALHGPAIMVGGTKEAFRQVEDLLTKIAAQGPEGPCCAYFGPGSAGHYVKMIHNGIEYAIMETIAEAYDLMRRGLGMTSGEMADVFGDWNVGELGGYLFEITERILRHPDGETGGALVESILDTAKQKGTGKWSTQSALDLGTPAPTIAMAVFARALSGLKIERVAAEKVLPGPALQFNTSREPFVEDLHGAVTLTVLMAYAQGLRQLRDASVERGYNLDLAEAARVWMAGCIIRAKMLVPIERAFREQPDLPLLFLAEPFLSLWKDNHLALRRVVIQAHEHGIPVPVLSSTLDFLDGYRSGRLPANLLQAQRDFFGAHTYQRVDKEGTFHTKWEEE
jgi:6-phosphogluconate dehydrogenase